MCAHSCQTQSPNLLMPSAEPAKPFRCRHAFWFSTECTRPKSHFKLCDLFNKSYLSRKSIYYLKNSIVPRWGVISAFKCCFFHGHHKFYFYIRFPFCSELFIADSQIFPIHSTLSVTFLRGIPRPKDTPNGSVY